ncbi:MAG: adenosylcobinamide amidohydrolase [Shinella sp.]|nr:adenosylcobinamide amidohydrolase [Shinella sp.]
MMPLQISCHPPFLVVDLGAPHRVLSWSLNRPGFVTARSIAWLQVKEDDLADADPAALIEGKMAAAGHGGAVGLMTSRDIRKHHRGEAVEGDVSADCVATVGLANAGRVGQPRAMHRAGTINFAIRVSRPMKPQGLIEALAIAVEARTAAILDLGWRVDGVAVTGTGTDCVAVAAPDLPDGDIYAGQHTPVGAAVGRAVYDAVRKGAGEWIAERRGA